MSNPATVKKKLSLLRRSPAKEVIYDALNRYLKWYLGEDINLGVVIADEIAKELENQYLQQIPKKVAKVKHKCLLDSIEECKAEQLKKKQ